MRGKETRGSRAFRDRMMQPGEQVLELLDGYTGKMFGFGESSQKNGTLIVTDRRVVFMRKGILSEDFESIARDQIVSVEESNVLGFRSLTIHTAGKSLGFKTAELQEWVERARNAIDGVVGPCGAKSPGSAVPESQPKEPAVEAPTNVTLPRSAAANGRDPKGARTNIERIAVGVARTMAKWLLGLPLVVLTWIAVTSSFPIAGHLGLVALLLALAGGLYHASKRGVSASKSFAARHRSSLVFITLALGPGSCIGLSMNAHEQERKAAALKEQQALARVAPEHIDIARRAVASARKRIAAGELGQAHVDLQAASRNLASIENLKAKPPGYHEVRSDAAGLLAVVKAVEAHGRAKDLLEDRNHEKAESILTDALRGLAQHESLLANADSPDPRGEIGETLERARKLASEVRIEKLRRRVAAGDALYDEGKFEPARATYFELVADLDKTLNDAGRPPAERESAKEMRQAIDEKLARAVRAKEFPDVVAYFTEWRGKKRALKAKIDRLGSEQAYRSLIVDLAVPLLYLSYIEQMAPDERRFVPAKYRSGSFTKARRKDLKRLEKRTQEQFAYVQSCGNAPKHSEWDNGNFEAERLTKRSAHDPDSIDVENCTPPKLTSGKCWVYTCEVRGKNVFGAMVLNRRTFQENGTTIRVLK